MAFDIIKHDVVMLRQHGWYEGIEFFQLRVEKQGTSSCLFFDILAVPFLVPEGPQLKPFL